MRNRRRHLRRDVAFDDQVQEAPIHLFENQDLRDIYQTNWGSIRSSLYRRPYQDILNCRLLQREGMLQSEDPSDAMRRVWNTFDHSIKVNISFGMILRNTISNRLRYFHASSNNATIFPFARLISSRRDLEEMLDEFQQIDLRQRALNQRENTSWVLHEVTNITFYCYKLTNVQKVGNSESNEIPKFLLNSRSVYCMHKNRKNELWKDNLCFFRCLGVDFHWDANQKSLVSHPRSKFVPQKITFDLYNHWKKNCPELDGVSPKDFDGVSLYDLWELENIFDISIVVMTLDENKSSTVIWSSGRKKSFAIHLNLYENHFSLIIDISNFKASFFIKASLSES